MSEKPCDWRGTLIEPGARVIYGAPVGRSIAMVEGEVVDFTKSGRVNVRVIRRAYGHAWDTSKEIVHVGQDRLTIVTELPPTDLPTEAEKIAKAKKRQEEYQRKNATHHWPPIDIGNPWRSRRCIRCGADSGREECPGTLQGANKNGS